MKVFEGTAIRIETKSLKTETRPDPGENPDYRIVGHYDRTFITLDNGFYGWFDEDTYVTKGDRLIVAGRPVKRSQTPSVCIYAIHNLSRDRLWPRRTWKPGYSLVKMICISLGVWLFSFGIFLVPAGLSFLAIGLYLFWEGYKTLTAKKAVKAYLQADPKLS